MHFVFVGSIRFRSGHLKRIYVKTRPDLDNREEMRGVSVLGFGFEGGGSPEKKVAPPPLADNHRLLRRTCIGEGGRGCRAFC